MNKLKKWSTQLQQQQTKQLPQKKHHSMKDLLPSIVVTAPVFHAEMSELKAELEWNTVHKQQQVEQQVEGGGGDEFNK